MKPQDLKVKLINRNRINKKGYSKVEVQVMSYDGDKMVRKYVDTKVLIKPEHWNRKTATISTKDEKHKEKQQLINLAHSSIYHFVQSGGQDYTIVDNLNVDSLVDFFPKINKRCKTLVDYIDDYYKYRVNAGHKRGTTKEFLTLKNRIISFDKWNKKTTYLSDINIMWSNRWEEHQRTIANYKDGTIGKSYAVLYTVLNYYYQLRDEINIEMTDKFKNDNFSRGGKSVNEANPLTMQQLLTLYNHEFDKPHLKKTKKMILLQCFIGIRHSDVNRLRPSNFDNGFLKFKPSKTEHKNIEVVQPLNNYAISLLQEVNYDTSVYKLANQVYNRNIEEVFVILREKYPDLKFKKYTSHNFRDTFISNAVQARINWKSILKWVGQSSYEIMNRYIYLSEEFQKEEMERMFKFMIINDKKIYYTE